MEEQLKNDIQQLMYQIDEITQSTNLLKNQLEEKRKELKAIQLKKDMESYNERESLIHTLKENLTYTSNEDIKKIIEYIEKLNKKAIEINYNQKIQNDESVIIKNLKPEDNNYYFKIDNYMVESKTLNKNFYDLIYYLLTNPEYKNKLEPLYQPKPSPTYILGKIETDYTEPIYKITPNYLGGYNNQKEPIQVGKHEVTQVYTKLKQKDRLKAIETIEKLINKKIEHNYDKNKA